MPTAGTPWQHQIVLRGLDVLLHVEIVLDGGGRCTLAGPREPALDPELTQRLLATPGPILGGVGGAAAAASHRRRGRREMPRWGRWREGEGGEIDQEDGMAEVGGRRRGRDGVGFGRFITCSLPFYQIELKAETHRTHIHSTVVEEVLYELDVPGSILEGDIFCCCLIFLLQIFYFEFLKYVLYVTAIIFRHDNIDSINIPLKLILIFTER
jgi:hypothetical protein